MSVPNQTYDDYYNGESFEEEGLEFDMTETEAVSDEETYNGEYSDEEYEDIDEEATDVPSDVSESNAELRNYKMNEISARSVQHRNYRRYKNDISDAESLAEGVDAENMQKFSASSQSVDLESQSTERTLRAESYQTDNEMTEVEDDANLEYEVEGEANQEFDVQDDANQEFEVEGEANPEFEVEDEANVEYEEEHADYKGAGEDEEYAEYQLEEDEAEYEYAEMTEEDDVDLQEEFECSEDEFAETNTNMSTVKGRDSYYETDQGEDTYVNGDYNEFDDGEQIVEEYFPNQHNLQNERKKGGMEKQYQNQPEMNFHEYQDNPCTDSSNEQQFSTDGRGYSTVRRCVKSPISDSLQLEQSSCDETGYDDESDYTLGHESHRTDFSEQSESTLVYQSEYNDSESLGSKSQSNKGKEYSKKNFSKVAKSQQSLLRGKRDEPKDEFGAAQLSPKAGKGNVASKSMSTSIRLDNKSNASGSFKSLKMEQNNFAYTEMLVERKENSKQSSRRKNGCRDAEDYMKPSNPKLQKLQQPRFEKVSYDAMSYKTNSSDVTYKSENSNRHQNGIRQSEDNTKSLSSRSRKSLIPRFERGVNLSKLSKIVTIDKHEFCEPVSEDSRTYNHEKEDTQTKRIKSQMSKSTRGSSDYAASQNDSNYTTDETATRKSGTLYREASDQTSNLPKYLMTNQTMYAKLPMEKSKEINFKLEQDMQYRQRLEDGSGDAGSYHNLKQRQTQIVYPNDQEEYMSDETEATNLEVKTTIQRMKPTRAADEREYTKSYAEYSNEIEASNGRNHCTDKVSKSNMTKMFSMQQTMYAKISSKDFEPKATKSEDLMKNEMSYYHANTEQMSYYEDGSGDAGRCLKSPNYKQAQQQLQQSTFDEAHAENQCNYDSHNAHIFVDSLDLQSEEVDEDDESKQSLEQTKNVDFKKLSQNPKALNRPMTNKTSNKERGRNSGRKSFSHTNEQVREIERHNQILARKIMSTKSTVTPSPKKLAATKSKTSMLSANATPTNAAIERQNKQRQIEAENLKNRKKMTAISARQPVYK